MRARMKTEEIARRIKQERRAQVRAKQQRDVTIALFVLYFLLLIPTLLNLILLVLIKNGC